MSGVGEVAAIAGLVGQAVQAASTLYTFFEDYKNVHLKIAETQAEISRLQEVLQAVEKLVAAAIATPSPPVRRFDGLKSCIANCITCLEELDVQLQRDFDVKHRPIARIFKKFKIAANKGHFNHIWRRISVLRKEISLELTVWQR